MASALETLGDYVKETRVLLQDTVSPYRYSDIDLVMALNIGLLEARRLRADLFLPVFTIPYNAVSGTIDMNVKVPMDPMYRPAFVYYMTGRVQLRDDEQTQDQRAASLMNKFVAQMLTIQA
jgi:hypothetical protein